MEVAELTNARVRNRRWHCQLNTTMLIGHSHPDVMAVLRAQTPRGTMFFANNEHGIRLVVALTMWLPAPSRRALSTAEPRRTPKPCSSAARSVLAVTACPQPSQLSPIRLPSLYRRS
jgi:hypothetical protein